MHVFLTICKSARCLQTWAWPAGLLPALERMGKTATFLFQPTEVMVLQNDTDGTEGCFVKLELPAVLFLSCLPSAEHNALEHLQFTG